MLLDKYAYAADSTCHQYEFCSEGPNGKIRKIIEYSYFQINGKSYYNLAFGDWDDTRQDINDLSVSNNGDRKKILATIAASVIEFTDHFQR